ncbi:unnamed protein product [Spirodela intermedia]|uniref:Phospholipid/glycerol acyltransferase domain-containing protein n=1 Tax=Spirodela intermedia TaxID=51605 RepID=A0A7I8KSA9_SPIIN|nr:unnamed protein product [Spirodela intermedia]
MEGGEWAARGAVWREKARDLQIRLRDRFRVTVTRPRRWTTGLPEAADSCYSATLRRAILRLRSLLGDASLSSPSSSMPMPPPSRILRVKTESEDEDRIDGSVIFQLLQYVAIPVIGNVCHVFMHGLNHIQIYGLEKFHSALLRRPKGKALLTVSNHVASVDDPFVIASLLPPSVMLDARNVRWTLCATDRCFRNPTLSTFFSCCKVLPVSRGDGVYQKGMDMALSKLNNGGWVHIFPEGSRSRDGGRTMASSKRGVGRLVMDADNTPIVIPLVHTGMQEIMPIGSCLPRIGKRVTVLVGDPITFEDLDLRSDESPTREAFYDAASTRIGHRLRELKLQAEQISSSLEQQQPPLRPGERATDLWRHADWEAFGTGTFMPSPQEGYSPPSAPSPPVPLPPIADNDDTEEAATDRRSLTIGFSYYYDGGGGGMVSRIRRLVPPTEFMGFAARGLLMCGGAEEGWCCLPEEQRRGRGRPL